MLTAGPSSPPLGALPPEISLAAKNRPGWLRAASTPLCSPRLGLMASQYHRTQAPPCHRAHLRTCRRAWRLVVLATQKASNWWGLTGRQKRVFRARAGRENRHEGGYIFG